MSFAAERQASLQALVDANAASASSTSQKYSQISQCTSLDSLASMLRDSTGPDAQDDAQALIQLVGLALQDLVQQGVLLQSEIDYWSQIEQSTPDRSAYLLQTFPKRLLRLFTVVLDRVRHLPQDILGSDSRFSLAAVQRAFPQPSHILAVLFPHLADQQQGSFARGPLPPDSSDTATINMRNCGEEPQSHRSIFKTFAPGFLARQEARIKRKALQEQLETVVSRLGLMAAASHQSIASSLRSMDSQTLASTLVQANSQMGGLESSSSPESSQLSGSLAALASTLHSGSQTTSSVMATNARPSYFEQAWPKLVSYPIGFYILSKQIYNNRDAIWLALADAKETVHGFLIGWVVEPVSKIVNTVRGKDGLSLTGRQSLSSDLDSLERMVIDFDREVYKMSDSELAQIKTNLRDGDLSEVLKAWENDIKTPLRSLVRGTLIRTLLIQIQKVKVDVDMAMSGIEAVLQSQQLTFAFVGVAPSLLILFGAYRWLKSTLRIGTPAVSSRSSQHARKQFWLAVRSIDALLSASPAPSSGDQENKDQEAQQLGYLLLELQTLRNFASAKHGRLPTRDKAVRKEFLKDVAVLESTAERSVKLRAIDRMWKTFAPVLGFSAAATL